MKLSAYGERRPCHHQPAAKHSKTPARSSQNDPLPPGRAATGGTLVAMGLPGMGVAAIAISSTGAGVSDGIVVGVRVGTAVCVPVAVGRAVALTVGEGVKK